MFITFEYYPLAQIIVLFGLQGSVSEITAHFLFADKFGDNRKTWPDLCLLHLNTTHWAQIIVLFGLRGPVSELTAHFLFGDKFGDKCKICQNWCLLHMNTTLWAQIIVLFGLRGFVSEITTHFLFVTNLALNVKFAKFVLITYEYYPLGPNYRPFWPTRLHFRDNGPLPVWCQILR